MVRLETQRLRLREFELPDSPAVYELSREESLRKWLPDQVYASQEEAEEVLAFLISRYAAREYPYVLAIEKLDTGEMIGHVGLSEISQGVEIGYAIGQRHQNKGYAAEAARAFAVWAKKEFGLACIYGIVKSANHASRRVLEKAGFCRVGDGVNKDGGTGEVREVYVYE